MEPPAGPPGLPVGLIKREDGIYADLAISAPTLKAAINHVFLSNAFLPGLSYPLLIKVLYGVGPELGGVTEVRLARDLRAIPPKRLALYKNPKIARGHAEYLFEHLYFEAEDLPDGSHLPERPAHLNIDEFIAQMWGRGIQFGLDVVAVAAAIAAARPERITIASDLDAEPGTDAAVAEVSSDLHRSDAPKLMADGRIDLQRFENRFPQIQKNMRLLKKMPPLPGQPGFDLAGRITLPSVPKDLTLAALAGDGTEVRQQPDGEYLVSTREGFLSVDTKTNRISITDKIISKEGVSGRTTGNLQLAGAYEEYGDVQEQREVIGSDITVHGNVYGNIHSRGGTVVLDHNLVSGSINNVAGDIKVAGVASSSVIHTHSGKIVIARAENCVITGTSVTLQEASNCEIIADEVRISMAEGCAIAARDVEIESAGPRRRTEMLIYVLVHEFPHMDEEIAELEARIASFAQTMADDREEAANIAALPDVRRYLALAAKLRTHELTLTPEQGQFLRKIADAVADELRVLGELKRNVQAAETQRKLLQDRLARVSAERVEALGLARCGLHVVTGETTVRTMAVATDITALTLLPPKDIKQRLRGTPTGGELLFCDSGGALDWHLSSHMGAPEPAQAAVPPGDAPA